MTLILVVEDEKAIRENLADLLEVEGYEVLTAANGRLGLELALEHRPDLILSDILMPEMNGYEMLTELRQHAGMAHIPFVFLTAKADRENMRAGMTLGADDYLTKPFTREEVLQAVIARLSKRQALEAEHAAKLDAMRRRMAVMLPHELRTPLTGIIGYAAFLSDNHEFLTPEQIREVADNILVYTRRLERLVQRFLLYAELELCIRNSERAETWRAERLENAADHITHIARDVAMQANRAADLRLDLEDASLRIAEPHFTVLVQEIVENAFKFSQPGRPVDVRSQVGADGMFHIVVTDRGRGMTRAQITEIGAYRQFERERYEQQGQGLGLAIAKRIAEIYGGALAIESVPGEGTTIRVTLSIAES